MPWPSKEWSSCSICETSATGAFIFCCCDQYCMTMAMLAAPQPSFGCLTNGTSSHTPGGPAANSNPERHSRAASLFRKKRLIELLTNSYDNQDQRDDSDH